MSVAKRMTISLPYFQSLANKTLTLSSYVTKTQGTNSRNANNQKQGEFVSLILSKLIQIKMSKNAHTPIFSRELLN